MDIELVSSELSRLLPITGRSHGVHVSSIIHHLAVGLGHYPAREGKPSRADELRMELGCTLEHAIAHRLTLEYPGRYVQSGELELDSLYGTPDLVDIGTRPDCAVEEIKLTWASSKNQYDIEGKKMWRYWVQLMAYCQMWHTRIGRLRVVFINGDYTYGKGESSGPQYRVWEAQFSRAELDRNWQMLLSNAADVEAE